MNPEQLANALFFKADETTPRRKNPRRWRVRRLPTNPVQRLLFCQRAIKDKEYPSQAALARYYKLDRSRITQIFKLADLSPRVIEIMRGLARSPKRVSERFLRGILGESDDEQWESLKKRCGRACWRLMTKGRAANRDSPLCDSVKFGETGTGDAAAGYSVFLRGVSEPD